MYIIVYMYNVKEQTMPIALTETKTGWPPTT